MPDSEEEKIREVHRNILSLEKNGESVSQKLHELSVRFYMRLEPLLQGQRIKQLSLGVYVGCYAAFFLGLIEYPVFSFTTSMAREVFSH